MASEPAYDGQVQARPDLDFAEAERLARATLDGLSAHIAIVAAGGTITAVNRAWREFAAANLPAGGSPRSLCEGANYVAVCRAAAAAGCGEAQQWLDGMGAVLAGETDLVEFEYACHSPDEQRWFIVHISPIPGYGPPRLVVAHETITKRRRSELAVSESEARYRSIFENNRSVMLLIERKTGAIFDANRAAAAYYGWTHEQLCRMTIGDIATTPIAEILAEWNRPYEEQRDHYTFEHRRAEGAVRDVEVYCGPVQVGGRELVCAIMHDITERRQAEQAVVRSEAALKHAQQVAHVGYWTWDIPSNTVTGSDEAWHIYGLDPETRVMDYDTATWQVMHPDDREWVQAKILQLRAERRLFDEEYRVVWPDGSVHYVHVMPDEIVLDENGNFERLSNVVQDITERKLAELEQDRLLAQLHDKAEQLAQVMHSVPEGVLLLDEGGGVVLANQRAQQLLAQLAEYDAGEGEKPRLARLAGAPLAALLTSPPVGQWHDLQAGTRYYEAIAWPVESGPVPAGWVMVLRDVTLERAMQEQLRRQERLAAVGQLAAGIAHDFNNLMSVISIYAELLSAAPGLSEKERARAETIMDQAQRATRMIRQILDFSRQSVFARQQLDLLPLLKEEVKLLRQTLPEHIAIAFAAAQGEYNVLADPTRIQQLVMNLAVNARDAMPQGGQLSFELAHLQVGPGDKLPVPGMAKGDWLRLAVNDTGSGISPAHLDHIFEPFFTTKEPGKGTGLGLAQVRGIVAMHDGHITVESELGAGTTFAIYLPVMEEADPTGAAAAAHSLLPQGSGQCILVVEDEAVVRAAVVALLETLRYQVVEAVNGEDALNYLEARRAQVDLIVSDVIMPRLGGIGLVRRLRQQGVDTPVILMSGHASDEERAGLAEAGIAAWLDKPPSTWLLAKAVGEALAVGGKTPTGCG
ncbi:MAG: PAS domain S-box protein [Caldilineaceae bacterium]